MAFKFENAILALLAVLCLNQSAVDATVVFDWVTVGNPGNAPDELYSSGNNPDNLRFGAVDYIYRISKHEVTNNQYAEFLNAVADTDTYGVYKPSMDSDARGGITQSGASGSFSYAVKSGRGNNPVVFVSFLDSMRFVNWLENGQPIGPQGSRTTEDGVYTISDGLSETRASLATFFIPSENEWYKAAYHKNDGMTGNYWDYPTSTDARIFSDQPPGSDAPTQSNTANFWVDDSTANGYDDGYAVTGSPDFDNAQNYLTDVGAYTHSSSPYGTFDQAGNVFEWIETVGESSPSRRLRGGNWCPAQNDFVAAIQRGGAPPLYVSNDIGFRVASIPEPNASFVFGVGILFLLRHRSLRPLPVAKEGQGSVRRLL